MPHTNSDTSTRTTIRTDGRPAPAPATDRARARARSRRRAALLAGAAALGATALLPATPPATAAPATGHGHPHTGHHQHADHPRLRPAESRQIAATTLGDDRRVTLTAVRSRTDQFAASVRLAVFRYEGGRWLEDDRARVGGRDSWFWFPLTGPDAVCEFSAASADPEPIEVSLLVTPSTGCSPVHDFHIDNGRIVRG